MKMKKTGSFVAVAAALALFSCTEKKADSVRLFNGTDLTGWVLYMQDSTLNPQQEFVVRDSVIALSGPFGYVRTDKAYSNYKLNAQWRWPDQQRDFRQHPAGRYLARLLRVPVVERPRRRPDQFGRSRLRRIPGRFDADDRDQNERIERKAGRGVEQRRGDLRR